MRKLIATLLVFFVFVGISVAQHQQGGGQNHNQNHGSAARGLQQHAQPQHGAQSGSQQHAQPQQWGSQHEQRPEYRGHRSERGYRSPYFHDHYVNRGFRWNSCRWYGPRYHMGSRFWYGGLWFEIVEVVPYDWYDGEVIIIEEGPGYYLYNPRYPGIRISVVVAF